MSPGRQALIDVVVREIVAEALVAERDRADMMADALRTVLRMIEDGHPNDPDWFRALCEHDVGRLLAQHDEARQAHYTAPAVLAGSATPGWWLCPNEPRCPHPSTLHDAEDLGGSRVICCADGCRCGRDPGSRP